jgi:hypothetical protein
MMPSIRDLNVCDGAGTSSAFDKQGIGLLKRRQQAANKTWGEH